MLVGCVETPLPRELQLAQERESAHDDAGALILYGMVEDGCRAKSLPRDACAEAMIRHARLLEGMHRETEALALWRKIPSLAESPRNAARAQARAAQLALALGDRTLARQLADVAVRRWPDEVPTDDSLDVAIQTRTRIEAAQFLAALWPFVEKTDLGDNVLFALGGLLEPGDPSGAVEVYRRLAATYKRSGLADDSVWRAAKLCRKLGRFDDAVRLLRDLLATRRDALITGSYNSIFLDDAQLLLGQILRDDLHDLPRAAEAFENLADDFPESTLRDDALVELADTEEKRTRKDAACAALARVTREFPDGNQLHRAAERRAAWGCP
jgi:tetratricopeptide (TPR) repeat protein